MEIKGSDEVERLKSRFMSAWNNVKYSWALKTKTPFSRNSAVFLLGKCYHFKVPDEDVSAEDCSTDPLDDDIMGDAAGFRRDFASRIWLTYREEFAALPNSGVTSDCGWGCTLRAGQMMLAQALVLHFLGRDWTWNESLALEPLDTETWTSSAARRLVASLEASFNSDRPSVPEPLCQHQCGAETADGDLTEGYHRSIVSWFGDTLSAQLGIHRLVQLGTMSGKRAGDWYGPAVMAHILRKAVEEATDPKLQGVTVYVAQDCTVYSADVMESHSGQRENHKNPQEAGRDARAVIILIPVRLGGERTNPEYFNFVKSILSLEYCIGIIGGKPKQAYYFVGFQDDSLIYMDPHYCQSFVDVSTSNFPLQSYHCPSPKKMPFIKMDPSCTIGFLSRNVEEYERISSELSKVLQPSSKDMKYPAFTFMTGHGRDQELSLPVEKKEWPFIRDPQRAGASAGDFVLL